MCVPPREAIGWRSCNSDACSLPYVPSLRLKYSLLEDDLAILSAGLFRIFVEFPDGLPRTGVCPGQVCVQVCVQAGEDTLTVADPRGAAAQRRGA